MVVKDVSNKIIDGVKDSFLKEGFNLNKSRKIFKKKSSDCEQIFQLLFYKKDDNIYIRPIIRIKIKPIEDIYHSISLKSSEYFEDTSTLGNNLGEIIKYYDTGKDEISENINMQYLIENEDDIEILIKAIPIKFHEYVLPYFESNCSVKSVDQLLNADPHKLSIHNVLYPIRACMGLIAAKLNNNPYYNEIVSVYEQNLKEANPDNKVEFQKLKDILK